MTQSRETPKPVSFPMSIAQAAFASAVAQPARILLNQASKYTSITTTFASSFPILFSGIGLNVLRGATASGTQLFTKENVNHVLVDVPPGLRIFPVIAATSMAGTLTALLIETPFIRYTEIKKMKLEGIATKASIARFTPMLPALYFCREAGFSAVVFYAAHMSFVPWLSLTAMGAAFTGATHRFITHEVTRDLMPKGITAPDFAKDGFRQTIRNIANTGVYTHPSMKSLFHEPPKTLSHKSLSFLYSACGYNMLIFRALYLVVFGSALKFGKENGNEAVSAIGLFAKRYTHSTEQALIEDESADLSRYDRFV